MSSAKRLLEEYIDKEASDMPGAVLSAEKALLAAKKLDLPTKRLKDVWAHIYEAIIEYEIEIGNGSTSLPFSKAEKSSAMKLQKFLKQIRVEANKFPTNYFGYLVYKRIAELPIDELVISLDTIVLGASAPQNRTDGEQKEIAARYAYRVLNSLQLKTSSTRGSPFIVVAASIYGDPDADFQHICRRILANKKKPKTGKK